MTYRGDGEEMTNNEFAGKRRKGGYVPFKEAAIMYLKEHGPMSAKAIAQSLCRRKNAGSGTTIGTMFKRDPRVIVHSRGCPTIWEYREESIR